jgi:hypothetical protein
MSKEGLEVFCPKCRDESCIRSQTPPSAIFLLVGTEPI